MESSDYSTNPKKILANALSGKRDLSMAYEILPPGKNGLYLFKLKNTNSAKRKGESLIRVRQEERNVFLEDIVKLEEKQKGFEQDIASLKCCMFYDLGGVEAGAVKDLGYTSTNKRVVSSFKTSKKESSKAIWHYLDIAAEVMGKYFKESIGEIDLAFSMARKRGTQEFLR